MKTTKKNYGAIIIILALTIISINVNAANTDQTFFSVEGHLVFYNFIPLPRPLVWATRIAGGVNYGDFSFYQAHFLGRDNGLRGYRENRIGGKSSFVWSNDLRAKLFRVNGKVIPFTLGTKVISSSTSLL